MRQDSLSDAGHQGDKRQQDKRQQDIAQQRHKAPVNKIIPLSVVDGPGCRTSVFVQGCNIACAYCHNPETQRLCFGCGICVSQCPAGALRFEAGAGSGRVIWDESACVQCDTCIRVCPHFASPKVRLMDAEAVWKEIERNMPFIQGITVSGGECSLYPEFLTDLFGKAKRAGLTCFLDSNGCVDLSHFPDLMAVTDKVMLDVKAWDSLVFERLTGRKDLEASPASAVTSIKNDEVVKKNLKYLAETGKLYEVRLVCLDGEMTREAAGKAPADQEVDMEAVITGVASEVRPYLSEFRLKLITFRRFGVKGRLAEKNGPSKERMEELKQLAVRCGYHDIQVV